MTRARIFALASLFTATGCVGGFGAPTQEDQDRQVVESIPPERLACPVDPDCAIGGDCSLYECPEYWVCVDGAEGGHTCVSPGPEYPDGGEWACEDVDGATVCRGSSFPDDGGGGVWSCEVSDEFVVCTDDTPSYPDDGGGGPWSCHYSGEFRICTDIPGDGGGWVCTSEDGLRHCQRDRPDLPGDGGWTCFDYEGVTHCDGGTDIPDGGGWTCVERGGLYYCTDDTPDYPDDGGGGPWTCRFSREFRVCDRPDIPDDGGDIPHYDCPVGDPSCGRHVCTAETRGAVTFVDDEDGEDNAELYVLGNGTRDESCGHVRVAVTGYYRLFDAALAESCTRQRDEISYVTITNTCNADGAPVERNVGDRFVIGDVDNTPECASDSECGGGSFCRARSAGYCCVPSEPAFVGTFLLLAEEDNRVCLHHFCPEYRMGGVGGDSFVSASCNSSIDSVHLRLDGDAFVCPDTSLEFPAGCGL